MSTDNRNHGRDDRDDSLKKLSAIARWIDDFVHRKEIEDEPRSLAGAHAPRTAGRIVSLVFKKLAGRLVRVDIDGDEFVLQQTVAFTLMALARPGGVARADARQYVLPETIAAEIGRLRGTPPPSRQAVATYVARLRTELAGARGDDGKDLILGDRANGWRLAIDENATVRFQ